MKFYEGIKCAVKDCQERAFCIYSGVWVCGKHLEEAHKKEQFTKLKNLMEIQE
jgi:hypothetical protein